jgi:hypothetical protein
VSLDIVTGSGTEQVLCSSSPKRFHMADILCPYPKQAISRDPTSPPVELSSGVNAPWGIGMDANTSLFSLSLCQRQPKAGKTDIILSRADRFL